MKGFKNVIFGVLIALISIFSNADMVAWIAEHLPGVGTLVGLIIIVLRAVTNSPIFKSE